MTTITTQTPTKTSRLHLSLPAALLKLEAGAILAAVLLLYADGGFSPLAFIALWLVPDLSALGYLHSKRLGAWSYNLVHTYAAPLLLIGLALSIDWTLGYQFGLIWISHIAIDRLIGYGLKYADSFKKTHLQQL